MSTNVKVLMAVGLLVVLAVGIAIGAMSGGNGDIAEAVPTPTHPPRPPLFADASDGIYQFVGGNNIPIGSYYFDCDYIGNTSVQLGGPPYTISMRDGAHFHDIKRGDLLTAGWCKIYGPQ